MPNDQYGFSVGVLTRILETKLLNPKLASTSRILIRLGEFRLVTETFHAVSKVKCALDRPFATIFVGQRDTFILRYLKLAMIVMKPDKTELLSLGVLLVVGIGSVGAFWGQ